MRYLISCLIAILCTGIIINPALANTESNDALAINTQMAAAQQKLDDHDTMGALQILRQLTQEHPDALAAYALLAQTHAKLGDHGQALLNYQKAIALDPTRSSLLLGLGSTYRHIGDLKKAQHTYELAQQRFPDNAKVHYELGHTYHAANRLEDAMDAYETALKLDPTMAKSYFGIGSCFEKQNKFAEAIAAYQQFIESAPPTDATLPVAKQRMHMLKQSFDETESDTNTPF